MSLSRRAMRNEIRTLTAQLDQARQEINRLTADLFEAQREPALARCVRLAHHLEQAEREIAVLKASEEMQTRRLAQFVARHPHLFDLDGADS